MHDLRRAPHLLCDVPNEADLRRQMRRGSVRLTFAHCSSSEMSLPCAVEAKPHLRRSASRGACTTHWAETASCSSGAYLAASRMRATIASLSSSLPVLEETMPSTTVFGRSPPFGRARRGSKLPELCESACSRSSRSTHRSSSNSCDVRGVGRRIAHEEVRVDVQVVEEDLGNGFVCIRSARPSDRSTDSRPCMALVSSAQIRPRTNSAKPISRQSCVRGAGLTAALEISSAQTIQRQ